MRLPWTKKIHSKEIKYKEYDYYNFCENFPELLAFWKPKYHDWSGKGEKDLENNLIEKLDNTSRINLIRYLKKVNKRIHFNTNKAKSIALNTDNIDPKFNIFHINFTVKYDNMSVFKIYMENNQPNVSIGAPGMRDHYFVYPEEFLTEKEFNYFLRKEKLKKIKRINDSV